MTIPCGSSKEATQCSDGHQHNHRRGSAHTFDGHILFIWWISGQSRQGILLKVACLPLCDSSCSVWPLSQQRWMHLQTENPTVLWTNVVSIHFFCCQEFRKIRVSSSSWCLHDAFMMSSYFRLSSNVFKRLQVCSPSCWYGWQRVRIQWKRGIPGQRLAKRFFLGTAFRKARIFFSYSAITHCPGHSMWPFVFFCV